MQQSREYVNRDDTAPVTFLYDASNPPSDFYNPPAASRMADNLIPLLQQKSDLYIAQMQVDYDLSSNLTLTLLPAYVKFASNSVNPFNATLPNYFGNNAEQYSFESRLAYRGSSLNALVGFFYVDTDSNLPVNPAINALGNPRPTRVEFGNHVKSYAVFGEATYSITDQLRLTAGGRYSNDRFAGFFRNDLAGINTGIVKDKSNRVDWKAQAEYDITRDNKIYAGAQTGYIMGGFNANPTGSLVSPEKLIAYTVGSKNRFLDRALTLNVEGFYYDYSNYHLQAVSGTIVSVFTTYETPAVIKGVEISADIRIGSNDNITASGLIQRAQIKTSTLRSPWTNASLDGQRLPNAPDQTLRLTWEHTFTLANGADIVSNASAFFSAEYSQEPTHHPNTRQGAYELYDFSLEYRAPGKKWVLAAYINNITDEPVMIGANTPNTLASPATPFLQPPRTYGVRLNFNF